MKTVMVVDDHLEICRTVRAVLENNGYNVLTAINGDDCLDKAKSTKIDMIIMDIMMPGTSVKEIVPKLKGTKVVYLSVVSLDEAKQEGLLKLENVVDFIQKPFDINELIAKVNKVTGGA